MKKIHIVLSVLIILVADRSLGQEVGSGEGSGDTLEAGSGVAEVSEVVEGSGGEAVTVEHSIPYSMASADGSLTVRKVVINLSSRQKMVIPFDIFQIDPGGPK